MCSIHAVPPPSPQEPYRQHISVDYPYNPSEPSLRKLVKDLHRCDISIMRYQQILHQVFHMQSKDHIFDYKVLFYSLFSNAIKQCAMCRGYLQCSELGSMPEKRTS